jgi:uncharacterized membrane protein
MTKRRKLLIVLIVMVVLLTIALNVWGIYLGLQGPQT